MAKQIGLGYLVCVDAEYESEWYLTPASFSTHLEALRHGFGIAKAWENCSNAPKILIRATGDPQAWDIQSLLYVGYLFNWRE